MRRPMPSTELEISQEMMKRLHELRVQKSIISQQEKMLRNMILDLHTDGAKVEQGRFSPDIQERSQVRFSQKNLKALYGARWVEDSKGLLQPVVSQILFIKDGECSSPLDWYEGE